MYNPFIKKKQEEVREASTVTAVESLFSDLSTNNAMAIPAVYSAVNIISNTVASAKIEDAPKALNREPEENITRFNWISTITKNILLHGNAFAEIKGNELVLLSPKSVSAFYDVNGEKIVYYQHLDRKIRPEMILHFKGISKDDLGMMGYSSLTNFKDSFNSIQAMKDYQNSYLINASRPSLWVSTLKNLSKDAIADLKETFKSQYQGLKNSGRVAVMSNGMELHELKAVNTLVDADLVALKAASLKDIAQIFNLPVSMLDNSLATYSNAVEANLNFLKLSINPLLTNIKEEINLKLYSNMRFDTSSLIEGSFEQKITTLNQAVAGGILTANEARARLNYKELKNGNTLFNPAGTPGANNAD